MIFTSLLLKDVGRNTFRLLSHTVHDPQNLRDELGGSQSYEVEIASAGPAGADGYALPLDDNRLREVVGSAHLNRNAFKDAPPDTDLEQDCKHGCNPQTTEDTSAWARTSSTAFVDLIDSVPIHLVVVVRYKLTKSKPNHVVVFGPNNFHLCSCLKLLRHGLLCRHYFAVLVKFLGGEYRGTRLGHDFQGSSVHTRWRSSPDGDDEPWSVSTVLRQAGHGDDWDGNDDGPEDNYGGPTFDDDDGGEGVHPAEREGRAGDRQAHDQRKAFATMMARSKANVSEILKAVSYPRALGIQADVDKYVKFLLENPDGDSKTKNPAQVPQKGRKKGQTASKPSAPSNPEPRKDNTRRKRRMKDGTDTGKASGRKKTKIKKEPTS